MRRVVAGVLSGDECVRTVPGLDAGRLTQRVAGEGFGLVDRAVHELVAVAPRLPVTATMLPWVLSLNTTRMTFSQ